MSASEVEKPATTYDWLASLPLTSTAGNTVFSWYESSKNCCSVSKFALGTVESSVKFAAGTAAPITRIIDRPLRAVDSIAVSQLVKLEEKVPAIKKEPNEVLEMLTDGKAAIYGRLNDGKQAVYDRISNGREAISSRIAGGKDAIATTLVNGKDAVYTRIQTGSEVLANTRAGVWVGQGVDRTLNATESLVDYFLPPEENEKELLSESLKTEKSESAIPLKGKEEQASEEEGEGEEEGKTVAVSVPPTCVTRVKTLSRKVQLRVYYRTLRRLHSVQQQCKGTLDQLKLSIDLLKVAQAAREGMGKQYQNMQTALKDLEAQLKSLLSRQAKEEGVSWLPEESGEGEDDIQWLIPKQNKSRVQATLDYAKELSERVYGTFQSMARATSYLPHHLKGGTSQAYAYAHELYMTLKSAKVPSDLPSATLNRISEVIDTQLGYCRQLGNYISGALQKRTLRRSKEEAESIDGSQGDSGNNSDEEEEEEEEEEDPSVDPSSSRQPPGEMEWVSSGGEDDKTD